MIKERLKEDLRIAEILSKLKNKSIDGEILKKLERGIKAEIEVANKYNTKVSEQSIRIYEMILLYIDLKRKEESGTKKIKTNQISTK